MLKLFICIFFRRRPPSLELVLSTSKGSG